MSKLTLNEWKRDFRAAARADQYDIFRGHLTFLGMSGRPDAMMRATILVVHAMTAYHKMDGRDPGDLLAMQHYNAAKSAGAPYELTFDLCGRAFARLLVDPELHSVDLSDLYCHPWDPYKVVGYSDIYITHADCSDLTKKEMRRLEKLVTEDLRFDYDEDEIDLWFDDSNARHLRVHVQDHLEADDDAYPSIRDDGSNREKPAWKWMEGIVDPGSEHLELRYGDAATSDYESWHPLALLGKPEGNAFPVTWVLTPKTPEEQEMIAQARQDLDFYLVEQRYEDPWAYACYHCCTASNIYSRIHWSYYPEGYRGERLASFVMRDGDKGNAVAIVKPDVGSHRKKPGKKPDLPNVTG